MTGKKRIIIIFLLAALLSSFPDTVRADIAPPTNPPGANVQPGAESTQVRMMAETVVLEVLDDGQVEGLGKAHVTADFTMRNLGSLEEIMQVRFPMSANDGRGEYPEITGVTVKVGGKTVSTSIVSFEQSGYGSDKVPWVEFEAAFPPGVDVMITVAYDLQGSGYYPYTAFYYLLETGAGWKDTIARAEIILRLPYEATPLNVVLDFEIGWAKTNRGAVFDGSEVRWLYEDFEPVPFTVVQNMNFVLVAPGAWKKVVQAQDEVEASPGDGEAWGRLAKVYKELFLLGRGYRDDAGGEELFRLSVEAYEECLRLKPSDAQWHAGFADLLANRAYWDSWMSGPNQDVYRALEEIQTALSLAPNDVKVKEIAESIYWLFPDGMVFVDPGYDFPWLTQTPTPRPPKPTVAPVFDPQQVKGEYTSPWLEIWDGQQVILQLRLNPDYTAVLETTFQGKDEKRIELGSWQDRGDGQLRLNLAWPNGDPYILVFKVEDDFLTAVEYPSYFKQKVSLEKVVEAQDLPTQTALPIPTQTLEPTVLPEPTRTPTAQPIQAATPTPQSAPVPEKTGKGLNLGVLGVIAGLVLLAVLGWLRRRRREN